ncbi:DJ-1/PfpI family protein [Novosphingobium sp. Chol11]|uniref:DJ-1/PfpI family protein n=1 Tax=Novosphingobium sp. Chol11 TaxID=1385763 RepID=UPI0025DDBC54|nr:DJ-1/PfpI family protein [Novosphingobium sp. Chol11]
MMDRRDLLRAAGVGSAAVLAPSLAPYLAIERAAAQVKIQTPDDMMADPGHMAKMEKVIGKGLMGSEQIAMLLYPGFTTLDLVGPHYFFACMFGAKVHLVTTAANLAPVASDLGLAVAPTMTMAECPRDLDLIFVPGGADGTLNVMLEKAAIAFIADRGSRAKHVTSVCTGSMVLGKAGLLKGKRATSHWAARPVLADFGATPVDARVVTDGNVTTGAGVSAGIDFGIAIVAALRGRAYAESLMLQAEYHPEPPFPGGTLATTSPEVSAMMQEMFAPLETKFRALAKPV